jgi:hypothetical protein
MIALNDRHKLIRRKKAQTAKKGILFCGPPANFQQQKPLALCLSALGFHK